MAGLILRTQADGMGFRLKHFRYFKRKKEVKNDFGGVKIVSERMQQEVPACETVKFKCPAPGCGQKNDISIFHAKVIDNEIFSFICKKCGREIEVEKPNDQSPSIIIPGIQTPKPFDLVNSLGQPIR